MLRGAAPVVALAHNEALGLFFANGCVGRYVSSVLSLVPNAANMLSSYPGRGLS